VDLLFRAVSQGVITSVDYILKINFYFTLKISPIAKLVVFSCLLGITGSTTQLLEFDEKLTATSDNEN